MQQREAAALFLPDGVAPSPGAMLRNPGLAETMQAIADAGWSGFYAGPVAAEMARFSESAGGFFRLGDFERQKATWGKPLVGRYRDVEIYNTPPPTQGFTVLEMLNLLEPQDLHRVNLLGPDRIHLLVQAKQIAYHDRDQLLADPAFADVPVEHLISKDYARERSRLIDPGSALSWDKVPSYGSLAGDTVYLAAVDRDGNAASLIQSLYGGFGACMVAGRTGVTLQNCGAYFSLDPSHPNRLEPGKIPLHTLIASIAKRNGRLWSVLGCMGADGQPQIQLQLYSALIDFGLDIQEAIEAPRFLSGRFSLGEARDTLQHRGPLPRRHHQRARAAGPYHQSLGALEREGRPCPRHHGRSAERRPQRRLGSAERRRGYRVLKHARRDQLARLTQSSRAMAGSSNRSRVLVYQPPSMRPIRSSLLVSMYCRCGSMTASS